MYTLSAHTVTRVVIYRIHVREGYTVIAIKKWRALTILESFPQHIIRYRVWDSIITLQVRSYAHNIQLCDTFPIYGLGSPVRNRQT